MNNDIIRMAREAGLECIYSACDEPGVRYAYEDLDEELERFAALVAAAEREACAQVCEGERWTAVTANVDHKVTHNMAIEDCAAAIRARGQA